MSSRVTLGRLESALAGPKPGESAHDRMSPRPRRGWPAGVDPRRPRDAAGLVLVFDDGEVLRLVLTVRTDRLGRHSGQVSLPGGAVDPGETFQQAALREAHEEIGLDPDAVRILGELTPIDVPVSGFRLHPVVGASNGRPLLRPSDLEVARILEARIDDLMAHGAARRHEMSREGRTIVAPCFLVDGLPVWGATAMIIAELLSVLGWTGPDFSDNF